MRFAGDSGPTENDILTAKNTHGDDLSAFLWDGPEDSDEEIEEMASLKNAFEKETGIKFSKRGIREYIESIINTETNKNTEDPAISKKWEEKLSTPNIKFLLKKGGSQFNSSQPFLRTESTFPNKFKMEKLVNAVYSPEHILKWDKNQLENYATPITEGKKSYSYSYNRQKK